MLQPIKPFLKGYKFRIYPTASQIILLENTFGCCRYVWNKTLTNVKALHLAAVTNQSNEKTVKPDVSGYGLVNQLIALKSDPNSLWLRDVSSTALQQTMIHLGTAFTAFFKKRKGFPNFKKKHGHQSFSLMHNSFRLIDNELFIAKSKESVRVNWSRVLPSSPASAVITKTPTGKYFIVFTCKYIPVKTTGLGQIGIDLGLKDFLVTSDGLKIPNPRYFKQAQINLRRKQKSLYRKQIGGKNRNKARIKVALIHEHVSNQRNDFHHKLARTLVNENQVIGVETLKVRNMIKNKKLSSLISDVGWGNFINRKLLYKARESQNCSIAFMNCWYPSSHICHVDGFKLEYKLKLSDRVWTCPHCNTVHDRDINAAINIRNAAMTVIRQMMISVGDGVSFIAAVER